MLIANSILAAIGALNALVTYQDFRYRLISAWIIPALIVLFVLFVWQGNQWSFIAQNLLLNLAYLFILMLGIVFYSYLKFKALTNPFDKLIGWGDILIILAFAFVFETKSFIIFITLSSILSLALALGLKLRNPEKEIQFPYAGMMCLVFLVTGLIQFITNMEITYLQTSLF